MICFAWLQFPQYAARCVGAFARKSTERVVVVATRPNVPIRGMEALVGCEVIWVDDNENRRLATILGVMPRLLICSGWGTPLFNAFRDEVRTNGGRAIAMCDNNYIFTFKELIKSIRFRLRFRSRYDGYLVAGVSGRKLLEFYGVPKELTRLGMYSADASVFNDGGGDVCSRPKKIIFVGQFIDRKNPIRLCEAFAAAKGYEKGWTLDLYGSGPLRNQIPTGQGVTVRDFLQPEELAHAYRNSRIFCLPSKEEHWGLVVHEAALSGCYLLLSNGIGAAADFLREGVNGQSFSPLSSREMTHTFERAMALSDEELRRASKISIEMANSISLESFVSSVRFFAEGERNG